MESRCDDIKHRANRSRSAGKLLEEREQLPASSGLRKVDLPCSDRHHLKPFCKTVDVPRNSFGCATFSRTRQFQRRCPPPSQHQTQVFMTSRYFNWSCQRLLHIGVH